MIQHKFSKSKDKEFSDVLRQRVNAYFKEADLGKNANAEMKLKTVVALSVYFVPLLLMLTGIITNIPVMFAMWIVMGFGKAFVGTSIMHDAVHGSYSKKKKINNIMSYAGPLVGMDPRVWHIQHNVLHHTFTNIEDSDEDIAPRYVMRFSPNQPRKWFHRYQHIYVWFFYSLSTFLWVLMKDYFKIAHYRKENLIKSGKEFNTVLAKMIFNKLLYLTVFLVLPILTFDVSIGMVLLMYTSMHLMAGLSLSLIFQPAHVISTSEFTDQEEELIDENWSVHQLKTTTNFAMNNKFITWVTGGLNYQVEHHLFPNVCHIHYPKIAPIVQKTTAEFNLPYYAQESFLSAVINHYTTLKNLGKNKVVSAA